MSESYGATSAKAPSTWPFWDALVALLGADAGIQAKLGGAGRVVQQWKAESGTPAGATESQAWGRLIVAPVQRLWSNDEKAGREFPLPFLIRTEIHDPGDPVFDAARTLDYLQGRAFTIINGWRPALGSALVKVTLPVYRSAAPQPMPLWDNERGLWFKFSEFRALLEPPDNVP